MITFLTNVATILGFITLASIALALIAVAVHYGFKLVDYVSLWLAGLKDTETKSDRILREKHKDQYDEDDKDWWDTEDLDSDEMPAGLPPIAYTMSDKYAEGKRVIRELNDYRKQQNIESSIRSHI